YSIFSEFYEKYGEGIIHHLGMKVDNYDYVLKNLKSKGLEILQSGNYLGKINYSYISTGSDINFIIEISEDVDQLFRREQ
ncbi:MAG: hypothetical protein M1308_20365, partial [Actinobacteria bacterium]|nr:hypothetical protein [Actinomycetota bacterium]